MRTIGLVAVLGVCFAAPTQGADIFVPDDHSTIQAAIDAAVSGDNVMVRAGTYLENLALKDGVNLASTDGATSTTVDGSNVVASTPVMDASGVTCSITGFTITGGSSPTMGGGIRVLNSSNVTVADCVISGNDADGQGGGLGVNNAQASVSNTRFTANTASGGAAAGVTSTAVTDVVFDNCTFDANDSSGPGGAVLGFSGMFSVSNSMVNGNDASSGGGFAVDGGGEMVITDTVLYGNTASEGGAMSFNNGSGTISGCTMHANSAGVGSCIAFVNGSDPTIERCLVTSSTGDIAFRCGQGSTPVVSCTNLFNNAGAGGDDICGTDGGNNGSVDPQYCHLNPELDGVFVLQSDSPCTATNSSCGMQIGAAGASCGAVSVESRTWGEIKSIYR